MDVFKVRVSFEVSLPVPGASLEDATEWIEYHLGSRGGMSMANLLEPFDIENSERVTVDAA